ncbi:MAG: hypothetical protein LWY06_20395 [Firmicutes bacterium]|nr:hypothetical protein [Bacillota bacterium]
MAGKIKAMIDKLLVERAKGNPIVEKTIKAGLLMRGIKVENFDRNSPDDPALIAKLTDMGKTYGINF